MAKISIIIPVYNSEKYIRRCLNSILNQTFQDFEIILIDDNSKDNSLKIASGEYITFIDKELEEQLNFLSIVNCLQRTRDILYSNIPYQKKKELITLVSSLIKVKYGTWQDNELYKKYKERRIPYNIRMSIIEKYFIEEIEELSEKEIKDAITKKLEKI